MSNLNLVLKQKESLENGFLEINKLIKQNQLKLNIVLTSNTFSVNSANAIYKDTAKNTLILLADNLKNTSSFAMYPPNKYIGMFSNANKENVALISQEITNFKIKPNNKKALATAYQTSCTNLSNCILEINDQLTSQLNDVLNLQQGLNKSIK